MPYNFTFALERAKIRIDEAVKRYEEEQEEQRQKELGPGGLHPGEVMESLPQVGALTVYWMGFCLKMGHFLAIVKPQGIQTFPSLMYIVVFSCIKQSNYCIAYTKHKKSKNHLPHNKM